MAHEFECPLGDPSRGIVVADDVPKRVSSDNHDFVVGEVVQELSGHHQHGEGSRWWTRGRVNSLF